MTVKTLRYIMDIRGQVQGVGFRPFVVRLARELTLAGHVLNNSKGVEIDLEGSVEQVEAFTARLSSELPPLARIDRLSSKPARPLGRRDFVIWASSHVAGDGQEARITPDARVCGDCLAEMRDPRDRRFGYPFINCTNCGPRYSIVRSVPYDRPQTTMSVFAMCPACQSEYDDPADRRFHAQPNACPVCGPKLWLVKADGSEVAGDPIEQAAAALQDGAIVAIKGLGGFHLACRADQAEVVERLRVRKGRETKPFAVMAADLAAAVRLAEVTPPDARLLDSVVSPIVLLPARADHGLSPAVAPGTDRLGVMLPYTPLHHLLFDQGLGPLVMTSGNWTDEPLCADNDDALDRLAPLADFLLVHDRGIHAPIDDAVIIAGQQSQPAVLVRRSRGYVPQVIGIEPPADPPADQPGLALGGDLKAVFAVVDGGDVVLSEHLGDLDGARSFRHYQASVERLCRLLRTKPQWLAHDLHPGYQSTAYARYQAGREGGGSLIMIAVQHHYAHLVSCLADNEHPGPAVGIICDGTGYGTDGAIWGGEVLVGDAAGFERVGHLRYYGLPGGDAAAKQTCRPAVSLLRDSLGEDWAERAPAIARRIAPDDRRLIEQMLAAGLNCPATSSLGRLFDAVAFILGLCDRNGHEAQAAMALEAAARASWAARESKLVDLPYDLIDGAVEATIELDVRPTIRAIVEAAAAGVSAADLAAAFHQAVIGLFADAAVAAARRSGLHTVVLSGGCMMNRILLDGLRQRLGDQDLTVLVHRRVPPGDGGLALGQAVVAARRIASEE